MLNSEKQKPFKIQNSKQKNTRSNSRIIHQNHKKTRSQKSGFFTMKKKNSKRLLSRNKTKQKQQKLRYKNFSS